MKSLKKIVANNHNVDKSIKISDATFPSPFENGLEYSAPARGTWNIVHTGMLIPESHQIFVCAQGCLRGVVLTAAELGMSDRFSTVAVCENNIISGDNEQLIIDGVTSIINELCQKPKAVLVYTSCVHHFLGCDLSVCYRELRNRFPNIKFTDCYMNPIMRKSGLTPDAKMRLQLYSLLNITERNDKTVSIIGNDFATDDESELIGLLKDNGFNFIEIPRCKTFDEYLALSTASVCITTFPAAIPAGKEMSKKHGQSHLNLPFSFNYDEILNNYNILCSALKINFPDFTHYILKCEKKLTELKDLICNTPIVIDYTAFSRPLSLAKLLLTHGFNVTTVYADSFSSEEKNDFDYLKYNYPNLSLCPTIHTSMRVKPRNCKEKTLAIGQKAAYFSSTGNFVNIVENGGYYGFEAVINLCRDMTDAFYNIKDTKTLIQIKGMGCCECM